MSYVTRVIYIFSTEWSYCKYG